MLHAAPTAIFITREQKERHAFEWCVDLVCRSLTAGCHAYARAQDESEDEDLDTSMALPVSMRAPGDGGAGLLQRYPGEECKIVLLVRMDLKMQKGKIAAQVTCTSPSGA